MGKKVAFIKCSFLLTIHPQQVSKSKMQAYICFPCVTGTMSLIVLIKDNIVLLLKSNQILTQSKAVVIAKVFDSTYN